MNLTAFLVSLALTLVSMGQAPQSNKVLPTFEDGYGLAIRYTEGHNEVAILDPSGQIVSDWMTITPENSKIQVSTGEITVIYHLQGNKVRDLPWYWTLWYGKTWIRSGPLVYNLP